MILQHGLSIRNITSESNAINDNNTETEATLKGDNEDEEMMVSVWIDLPNALVKNKNKENN